MKLLGIRFCSVSRHAAELAEFFRRLGLAPSPDTADEASFSGAMFPADRSGQSWIEIWPASEGFAGTTMLQLVVGDADQMAETARRNGLSVEGPMDAHGERIYQVTAPGGLSVSFQSKHQTG